MASYKKAYFDLIAENDRLIVKLNKIKEFIQRISCNICKSDDDVCKECNVKHILRIIESEYVSNNNQQ